MFTYELAKRLGGSGVTANALHPGFVNTGFGHNNGGLTRFFVRLSQRFGAKTPEEGAQTTIYLASPPEVGDVTGKYFANCKAVPSHESSYQEVDNYRLWELSEKWCGINHSAP
jgi:NAD(P)-dependent dehydrogenase (short-subunit alcohol dehydrogenase family)